MDEVLYSRSGAYRIDLNGRNPRGATWPFGKLVFRDQGFTFTYSMWGSGTYNFSYADIDHIELSKDSWGWIWFIAKDDSKSFKFQVSTGTEKIIQILQENGVSISQDELSKLTRVKLEGIGALVYRIVFVLLFLTILRIILYSISNN